MNSNSLANWGVDLVLNKNPMYLYAWGSGMNILYPLIVVPFIKILGLSIFSVRLPIVILSLFSIIYFNFALEKANVRLKLRIVLNYFIFLYIISSLCIVISFIETIISFSDNNSIFSKCIR